jgi:hypothetical protein
MNRFFRNYGLSLTLAVLFLVSWAAQFFVQMAEVTNQALEHGQQFEWSDFWSQFGVSTFENWQSEFLQLLTFVILTSFLIHKGSAESKDSDDKMQASLDRIEKRLGSLDGKAKSTSKR